MYRDSWIMLAVVCVLGVVGLWVLGDPRVDDPNWMGTPSVTVDVGTPPVVTFVSVPETIVTLVVTK